MVAEPGAATDGRARIPAHVAAGKTSVLVAWVGYAPQLLETHATNVAVEVHFNVPSPDSYAKRTALVQDRGCIVTLSGVSRGAKGFAKQFMILRGELGEPLRRT